MSENSLLNVTESFKTQETFISSNKPAAMTDRKYEEAAQIFDLISQLNSTLSSNSSSSTSNNNVTTTSSNGPSSASLSSSSSPEQPAAVEQTKPIESKPAATQGGGAGTKIPRINFLHNKPPPTPIQTQSVAQSSSHSITQNMSSSASNSSMGSIPPQQQQQQQSQPVSPDADTMIPRPVLPTSGGTTSRVPRSIVRNSALSAAAAAAAAASSGSSTTATKSFISGIAVRNQTSETSTPTSALPLATNGAMTNTKIPGIAKRGTSLSNAPCRMKSTRSMSINDGSKENLDDCESVVSSEGKKKVRYIIRHKPRESQVKIFSQKVEVKAKAKIGSLEKAASYTPAGGNVKIQSQKLNWNAAPKIGSLEKAATYKPHGGNVKIESFKLNFKERAKPKTDTGLIVVEEYIDTKSYQNSNEDLTKSQLSFTGSN